MTSSNNTQHDIHEQSLFLLPWYFNQTLNEQDRILVESHMKDCLICRREFNSLKALANHLDNDTGLEEAAQLSFDRVNRRLQNIGVPAPELMHSTKRSIIGPATRPLAKRLTGLAVAASVVLAAMPALLYFQGENDYRTLSNMPSKISEKTQIRVAFAKRLSDDEIERLLSHIHGRRIGMPNSMGAFTVEVDNQSSAMSLDDALTWLRAQQNVMLAEPVVQP